MTAIKLLWAGFYRAARQELAGMRRGLIFLVSALITFLRNYIHNKIRKQNKYNSFNKLKGFHSRPKPLTA